MTAAWLTPPPERVDAVVFDCDGLLVDTEPRWSIAEAALFARHGLPFGPEQKALLIGRSLAAAAANMATAFGRSGEGAAVAEELMAGVVAAIAEQADPLPGAEAILRSCRERVPIAVASNSPRALLDAALQRSGMDEWTDVTLAADDVAHPKPAPDLYLRACARLGAEPARSVAFEDSATGVAAARAAGLYVVVVPSLPGTAPDHDWLLPSLEHPDLAAWAAALTSRRQGR